MGRSQETFNKKEVRNKKEKKRKEKEKKRLAKKDSPKGSSSLDDMIAYVDENGMLTDTPPDPTVKKKEIKLADIEIGVPKSDPSAKADIRREGILDFYNDSKGFGFIKEKGSYDKIFVHMSNFVDDIREGNKVSFEVEKGPKGLTAVRVQIVK